MAQLISLESGAFGDAAHVIAFRGRESIGAPYEIEIFLTVPVSEEIDVADTVGAKATITTDRGDDGPKLSWSGILLEVDVLAELSASSREHERSLVRAVLVPKAYRLAQTLHTRVWTQKSVVDILKDVFEKNGLRGEDIDTSGLKADYPPEEHVAQWHETDLDFVHRWMEREGIFYWFKQEDGAEKLMLVDANPGEDAIPARYHALSAGDTSAGPSLSRFRCDGKALTGIVKVVDRDYAAPTLTMAKEENVSDFPGETVHHHSRLVRNADVSRIAKVRGEQLKALAKVYRAEGSVLGLSPGAVFKLEDHPRSAFETEYLVTEAEHVGWNEAPSREMMALIDVEAPRVTSELYQVRLVGLEKKTPYRLQRRTQWPRVDGYETALVDGPAESDYAQLDDQGRYLVRFHADESMGEDGKVSTWIRMMQPHAGAPEGMHFPLRKGTEVIVAFLGGDPDRPVILGAVPNAVTPSPVTKSNNTQNRLFTGGGSQLEIEDKDGEQYVHWFTPTDDTHIHMGAPRKMSGKGAPSHEAKASLGFSTDGNCVLSVGGSWDIGVGATKHEIVKGAVTEEYNTSRKETVGGLVHEIYKANHVLQVSSLQSVTVGGGKVDKISSGWNQTITGGWTQNITGNSSHDINGTWSQTVASGWTQSVNSGYLGTISGGVSMHVSGGYNLHTDTMNLQVKGACKWKSASVDHKVGTEYKLTCPSIKTVGAAWERLDSSFFEYKEAGCEYGVFKSEGFAVAIALTGVNIEITPALKVDLVGFKLENKGVNLTEAGALMKAGGFWGMMKGIITLA